MSAFHSPDPGALTVAQRFVAFKAREHGWSAPFALEIRDGCRGPSNCAILTRRGRLARVLPNGALVHSIDGGKRG